MMDDRYDTPITPAIETKVHRAFPKAVRSTIRAAGRCPNCKRAGQVSFQFPEDWDIEPRKGEERCGYYCVACGWANAGWRMTEKDQLE